MGSGLGLSAGDTVDTVRLGLPRRFINILCFLVPPEVGYNFVIKSRKAPIVCKPFLLRTNKGLPYLGKVIPVGSAGFKISPGFLRDFLMLAHFFCVGSTQWCAGIN